MDNNKDFELWLPIRGFEKIYEVSNLGRVRRIIYKGSIVEIPIKPNVSRNGYHQIGLRDYDRRIRKWFTIHRLVAIAFIPNPENKTQVNHIDGNKLNNNVINLEWATCSENIKHSWKTGLSKINSGCFKKRA